MRANIIAHAVDRDGLIFTVDMLTQDSAELDNPAEADLGMTEPNPAGRIYPTAPPPRTTWPPAAAPTAATPTPPTAPTDEPSAKTETRTPQSLATSPRRPARRKRSTPTTPPTHLRNWFRPHIWQPTLTAAGIPPGIRTHDLRHASWLLAGGADVQTVKERLGDGNIRTTQQYLHTLTGPDDTALDALHRIRHR